MDAFRPKPYRLINKIQHYAWGSKNEQAFIPKLLGLKPEPNLPYAELWMGTHPNAPSEVETEQGRQSLIEFIRRYPEEILGAPVHKVFNEELPFLFKVLSAGEALSIQAHPNKEQAIALHARDPEHYPDDNHKPEIAIAIDHLTALVGFCPQEEIETLLHDYPELVQYIGQNVVQNFLQSTDENRIHAFRELFSTLMTKGTADPQKLESALSALEKRLQAKSVLNEKEVLFLELRPKYQTDVGLLVIFFLNLVHLHEGQGIFLKAGLPHAYVLGNIVECMANSDNVVRAGLTPKFKDVKTLTEILTYEMGKISPYNPDRGKEVFIYHVPVPEFSVRKIQLNSGRTISRTLRSIEICIVIKGKVSLKFGNESATFQQGDSILLPAALKTVEYQAVEESVMYCAFVPTDANGSR